MREIRFAPETVEHVTAKRMPLGNRWMVEFTLWIVDHSKLLHHPYRPPVSRVGECHDLLQANDLEPMLQSRPCTLGSQPLTPVLCRQPPTNLDAWSEMALEPRLVEPDEADAPVILPM